MSYYKSLDSKQLELLEGGYEMKNKSAIRVSIVSLEIVRESSLLYKNRHIRSPRDSYDLIRTFIEDSYREMFICMSLDTKN